MHKLLPLFLFALVACSSNEDESSSLRLQADKITIIRDDFGVPHVYGKTDADAVFGLMYAQCEDDFPRIERNYIWATGRLAEVDGEQALYSDLRARMFMTQGEAIANYEKSPKWLKDLCDAWADGINYYLETHSNVQPELLTHFEPWMPMYFSEGSIGGDIERISTRGIQAFYEGKSIALHSDGKELMKAIYEEPKGSNGFAISGDLTTSGNAMLLINPHTSFYFRGEVHMMSEEGLNAYGAVTWGQFFIYQGFNEKTGWMHTSTYTDVMDEFVETTREVDGKIEYKYGDEWREVTQSSVTLQYIDGGQMKEKTFPMYRTHHGPITHKIGDQWVATAMMWNPVQALIQSYTRTKKSNLAEFTEMMDIRTNSSNNTVFADAEGNIGYFHGNFIPRRDTQFDYSQPVDGSNPATDWNGLHEVSEAITVFNPPNGWIQNCNSTPFTSAAEFSPKVEDYPYYMSRNRETFRGEHAIKVLTGIKDVTLDTLIQLAYDSEVPAFEKVIPGLVAAFDRSSQDEGLKDAIEVLRNWDMRTSKESIGMSLAHFYGINLYRMGKSPKELQGMNRFNYFGTDAPDQERLTIFQETIAQMTENFGSWDVPWGDINRLQRLNGDINLQFDDDQPSIAIGLASGRWGALASFGARAGANTNKIYGTSGNSFVAVVEFGDKVKAKSLLAGGQSNDPQSPHFFDQAQRYADVQFKDVPYYKEDVLKRAERSYKPGE